MPTHVLIVEGDTALSSRLSSALQQRGHTVEETSDGRGVIDLVRRQPPGAIVLAVELPGGQNGYLLVRQAQEGRGAQVHPGHHRGESRRLRGTRPGRESRQRVPAEADGHPEGSHRRGRLSGASEETRSCWRRRPPSPATRTSTSSTPPSTTRPGPRPAPPGRAPSSARAGPEAAAPAPRAKAPASAEDDFSGRSPPRKVRRKVRRWSSSLTHLRPPGDGSGVARGRRPGRGRAGQGLRRRGAGGAAGAGRAPGRGAGRLRRERRAAAAPLRASRGRAAGGGPARRARAGGTARARAEGRALPARWTAEGPPDAARPDGPGAAAPRAGAPGRRTAGRRRDPADAGGPAGRRAAGPRAESRPCRGCGAPGPGHAERAGAAEAELAQLREQQAAPAASPEELESLDARLAELEDETGRTASGLPGSTRA